ncbi:MAG: MMPL family transporter [Solirubrobacterales bacterium]
MEIKPPDDLLGDEFGSEIEIQELSGAASRARAPLTRALPGRDQQTPPAPPERRRLALRAPKAIIGIWLALALVLGVIGLFAKQVLHAEDLIISGTPSAKALAADQKAFGKSSPVTVMLEGPASQLDTYGPQLVKKLNAIEGVSAASPWSAGAPDLMRQVPTRALIMITVSKSVISAGKDTLPQINAAVASTLPSSVHASIAGEARFSTELVNLVFSGALKAEILAFPFLLLILLLIFRAPIAAGVPLVQGLAVIGVTTGFVTLLGLLMPVNILAQASGSIIGLALGVDYSLLFVQRFRDELALGKTVDDAVDASLRTAGKTVTFAGGILVLAGLLVIAVCFGWASMTTGTIGVITAGLVSIVAALTLLPACLKLIGTDIDRWSIAGKNPTPRLAPAVNRITRHPVAATLASLIPLLVLCGFALTLRTGGPDLEMFRADNPMRVDTEAVAKQYGGGVLAPYEVIATSDDLPLTSPSDVRALSSFQQRVAADPSAKYVIGLGNNRVRNVSGATESAPSSLARLSTGLGAASTGASQVDKKLREAGAGASQLAAANSAALSGAQQLASGLAQAQSGSTRLSSGLGRASSGAQSIDSAVAKLQDGAAQLKYGARSARNSARTFASSLGVLESMVGSTGDAISSISSGSQQATSAIDQAIAAIDSLPSADQNEPSVQSARSALSSARGQASSAGSGISEAQASNSRVKNALSYSRIWADRARSGGNQLDDGAAKLRAGVDALAGGTDRLTSGLTDLKSGSGQLANGLTPLSSGSQRLASGLSGAAGGSSALASGLTSGTGGTSKLSRNLKSGDKEISKLREQADAQGDVSMKQVGKSPYLTMALLSAMPTEQKRNLAMVLNESRGGTATRAYIFTEQEPTDKSLAGFNERLQKDAAPLAKQLGANVAVGGAGRTFLDYDNFTKHRIPLLLAALSLMSFLFLLIAFRSPLLALKAVILNLITVGAAMGLIALLFGGGNPLFGGPGWMEATSFFVVYSVTFALSMDYEIFMINRMRESYLRHGSNEKAITDGVTKTAGIVTGSALVMCVLFTAMAFTTELVSSAQLGLGLAFAIAIDATIVRLILLPATMRLFGQANWWMPSWLERVTPNVAVH